MAVTWTIATLERNTSDDGVVVAHWRASDVDGDHSGSSYGTCGFTPNAEAEGYTAYSEITEEMAIGWTKDSLGEEQVESIEASIAAQIDVEKNPTQEAGVPW